MKLLRRYLICMKGILFILLTLFLSPSFPQTGKSFVVRAKVVDGDTIMLADLHEVWIISKYAFTSKKAEKQYNKLVKNVKKVYPYAKAAGDKFSEYEILLVNAETEKMKKKLMKKAEEELKEEFGDEIKQLTFSQGKILIKLVDRETGNSSYEIIRELRGKFMAFFWQSFARVFGYNLKEEYDPFGRDKEIESIVRMIEDGVI